MKKEKRKKEIFGAVAAGMCLAACLTGCAVTKQEDDNHGESKKKRGDAEPFRAVSKGEDRSERRGLRRVSRGICGFLRKPVKREPGNGGRGGKEYDGVTAFRHDSA